MAIILVIDVHGWTTLLLRLTGLLDALKDAVRFEVQRSLKPSRAAAAEQRHLHNRTLKELAGRLKAAVASHQAEVCRLDALERRIGRLESVDRIDAAQRETEATLSRGLDSVPLDNME